MILVAQISAGIWAYSNSDKLQNLLRYTVSNTVQYEYGKPGSYRKDSFDAIQKGVRKYLRYIPHFIIHINLYMC